MYMFVLTLRTEKYRKTFGIWKQLNRILTMIMIFKVIIIQVSARIKDPSVT